VKKILFCLLGIGQLSMTTAQYAVASGTTLLQVSEWDKTIQIYNLATTWETEDLAPWHVGGFVSGSYSFLLWSKPQIYAVPQIRYSYWKTGNNQLSAHLHQLTIGPEFRFNPRALLFGIESAGPLGPRWYIGLQPSLQLWMPMVKRRDSWTTYDEETPYRPLTTRFDLKFSTGFHSMTIGQWVVTPELSADWLKGTELYDWAEQIHGHNIIGLENKTNKGWNWNFGLILTRLKKSSQWWDRPRGT
jgi:hypothetical protein